MNKEKYSSFIASFTVLKPARNAKPQENVCAPFNRRNLSSRYLLISGVMITALSMRLNESIARVLSLFVSMAHNRYGSDMIIKESWYPSFSSAFFCSVCVNLPGTIQSTNELQKSLYCSTQLIKAAGRCFLAASSKTICFNLVPLSVINSVGTITNPASIVPPRVLYLCNKICSSLPGKDTGTVFSTSASSSVIPTSVVLEMTI